jgi:6-phosphogluconolactonase
MQPEITIVPDAAALGERAADRFVAAAAEAVDARGIAFIVLAGGSTPRAMNELLATSPRRERVAWDKLRFFFGDERCVPPEHPDSNYGMTRATLFAPLDIEPSHVFRMHGEMDASPAAESYDAIIEHELGQLPVFDHIFLGMGPDGHTASLFPGTVGTIMFESRRAVANFVPKFNAYRLTLTPHAINAARGITFTVGGAEKAEALAAVLDGPREPERYPAQLIAPSAGRLEWLVSADAARLITPHAST